MFQEATDNPTWISIALSVFPYFTGGLAGAILTNAIKAGVEKRRQKKISLDTADIFLSLPQVPTPNQPIQDLKVSLQGQEYENPRHFSATVKNIGRVAVDGLKLVFVLPVEATIIKSGVSTTPVAISHELRAEEINASKELEYSFEQLERNDTLHVSFLLDSDNRDEIVCISRGVEQLNIISDGSTETHAKTSSFRILLNMVNYIFMFSILTFTMLSVSSFFFDYPRDFNPFSPGSLIASELPIIDATGDAIRLSGKFTYNGHPETLVKPNELEIFAYYDPETGQPGQIIEYEPELGGFPFPDLDKVFSFRRQGAERPEDELWLFLSNRAASVQGRIEWVPSTNGVWNLRVR